MSWYCKCGSHNKYEQFPCVKCGVDMPIVEKAKPKEPEVKRSHHKAPVKKGK
uniref:RanBP2-type domain-containing protein n=1 Tax=viral metagenome TaxID=1070528 RepID=A0A6M3JUT0_9ZZZZ